MSNDERAKIIRAVREYNAASNSLKRAHAELQAAIPQGITVLHKCPGEGSDLYWSYEIGINDKADVIYEGVLKVSAEQTGAVIIEAPARSVEFLPRLEKP